MEFDRELPFSPDCLLDALIPFPPLPAELILIILRLACMDGGQTARRLCLVSKHFHALAKPLLFHSITIIGVIQMMEFLRRLGQDPLIPATVRHLFLSEQPLPFSPQLTDLCDPFHWSHKIIFIVAPYLETLCHVPYDDMRGGFTLAIPFPRLRELTLSAGRVHFKRPIPTLERFHAYSHSPCPAFYNLDQMCPRLTHLKVTDFSSDGEVLVHGLQQFWGDPLCGPSQGRPPFRLPALDNIIIQPSPLSWGVCGNGNVRSIKRMARLEGLAKSELAAGLTLEMPIHPERWYKQMRLDWLSRLDGGKGCWEVRKYLEVDLTAFSFGFRTIST
ncbi:hypothetical protein BOTBODRAFT_185968 [Botryobasidium botryosum FD-172 SS1]|uniref:F-box domain-containing protein n=1 Tax=Botryobasidium botryosum (strain FD-172 SS1) TaxID=930990 RepID=A0A067MZE8_BOTB1|nr:hypothetical protein BOTBODRAFT_185968 [Botryobasidium botryosum FD-172 SS1]